MEIVTLWLSVHGSSGWCCTDLVVLSRMRTLLEKQSPGSLLTGFMLALSSRSAVKCFSGSSCHCPTQVTPYQRWWFCCAGTGQGIRRVHSVVQVTLSFLSVSAWCCLGVFQEGEMTAKFPFSEYSGFAHLGGRGVRPKVFQQLGSHSGGCCNPLSQLFCSCLPAPTDGYKCH